MSSKNFLFIVQNHPFSLFSLFFQHQNCLIVSFFDFHQVNIKSATLKGSYFCVTSAHFLLHKFFSVAEFYALNKHPFRCLFGLCLTDKSIFFCCFQVIEEIIESFLQFIRCIILDVIMFIFSDIHITTFK
nr:MAG TPA: hypothetical protein [Caudoviricetes sp.]